MENFLSGAIMGFREGLEAFLVIAILLQYLNKIKQPQLKKNVWLGVSTGIAASLTIGFALKLLGMAIENAEQFAKLWEAGASLVALGLITTFIIWMIRHGSDMASTIKNQVDANLSPIGIFLVAFVMVAREGTEIAIFTFAGKYTAVSISIGILASLVLVTLIFYSLVKVDLKIIFGVTLAYLILQAGFLLGYGIHEGLSAFADLGYLSTDSFLYTKAFDLSNTILGHKDGLLGLPFYVLFGWYSKPEWIQFIAQYGYTIFMFVYWYRLKKKSLN